MKTLFSLFIILFAFSENSSALRKVVVEKQFSDSLAIRQVAASYEYFRKSNPELAISELKKANRVFTRSRDSSGLMAVHKALAEFYSNSGAEKEAIDEYKSAWKLCRVSDTLQRIILLSNLADVFLRTGNLKDALHADSAILNLVRSSGSKGDLARLYLHFAKIMNLQKRYPEAERLLLKQALPLYSSLGNSTGRMESFDCLARGYYLRSRFSEAKWFYIQENMLARTVNSPDAIIQSLVGLGMVKAAIRDYGLATRDFEEAEKLSLRYQRLPQLISIYRQLGSLYKIGGAVSKSKNAYSRSAYWERVGNEIKVKDAHMALKLKADFDKASREILVKARKPGKETETTPESSLILIIVLVFIFLISGVFIFRKIRPKA